MVAMLGRPWAWFTTSAGTRPNLWAQAGHTRATAGVESTKTPSISNSNARQRICIANMIISLRPGMRGETRSDADGMVDPKTADFRGGNELRLTADEPEAGP